MFTASASAAISVIGKGKIDELIKLGFRPEWIGDEDAEKFLSAAIALRLRGAPLEEINLTNVLCRTSGIHAVKTIAEAWLDGHGSEAKIAVDAAKSDYLERNVREWKLSFDDLLSNRPGEIRDWLSGKSQELSALSRTGQVYSPSPREHMKKPLPEILAPFPHRTLNEIFRGGLWSYALVGISAPSGHGKTTLTNSLVSMVSLMSPNLIGKQKVVIVSGEMPEQYYSAALLVSWGIPWTTVAKFQKSGPDDSEVGKNYQSYLEYADKWVSVYGTKFMSLKAIRQIVDIEQPALVIIDHFNAIKQDRNKYQSDSSALSDLANGLEELSVEAGCMIVFFSQLSNENKAKFIKDHDLPTFSGLGSGGIENAVRLGVIMSKHWAKLDTQYFRVKKNSLPPPADRSIDTIHEMAYCADRMVYADIERQYTYGGDAVGV